jgi:hypothetical protein
LPRRCQATPEATGVRYRTPAKRCAVRARTISSYRMRQFFTYRPISVAVLVFLWLASSESPVDRRRRGIRLRCPLANTGCRDGRPGRASPAPTGSHGCLNERQGNL